MKFSLSLLTLTVAVLAAPAQLPLDTDLELKPESATVNPCTSVCDFGKLPEDASKADRRAHRATLCSAAGRRRMLACARCIDANWAHTAEDSAVHELGHVLVECEMSK